MKKQALANDSEKTCKVNGTVFAVHLKVLELLKLYTSNHVKSH